LEKEPQIAQKINRKGHKDFREGRRGKNQRFHRKNRKERKEFREGRRGKKPQIT
jgi:hypothetical protein